MRGWVSHSLPRSPFSMAMAQLLLELWLWGVAVSLLLHRVLEPCGRQSPASACLATGEFLCSWEGTPIGGDFLFMVFR